MTPEAWYTIAVIALIVGVLLTNRIGVDVAMVGGLTLLMLGNELFTGEVVGVESAIAGFAHPAVLLIGSLLVVAAGLRETGGMEMVAQRLLGRPKSVTGAQVRLMAPVALMSAFMNNTPIVAIYLPIVNDWAKKLRISPSKLMIPLSFSSILGGKITYIGTASNIVIMGLYLEHLSRSGEAISATARFWSIAWLGVPTTIAGIAFIALASRWLLPARKQVEDVQPDARQYQVEMIVQPDAPIVGRTIEEAGLRSLPGLYLMQIERKHVTRTAVGPDEVVRADDRLAFVGVLDSVIDLRKIRGLVPATDQVGKVQAERATRMLVEAVVSRKSHLVGRSVREAKFRTRYNAAIIAVHRKGQQIKKKIGDIKLQPGDTLLLEAHEGFVRAYRHSQEFFLVSGVEGSRPIRHERAWVALGILLLLVGLFTLTDVPQVPAALLCAMLMIGTRCVTGTIARRSINWQILIVIASAIGMGQALEHTGAAASIATSLTDLATQLGFGAFGMLCAMFAIAAVFAQVINTTGAAVLMFPIVMATAQGLGVNPEPFVFTLMIAAGSSFVSPVSYQTNLMVYGPGGYTFADFIRIGLPLTIVVGIVSVIIAPLVFPFQ